MATTKRTIDIDIKNNANKTAKDIDNLNKSLNNSKKAYDAVLKSGDSYEKQLADIDKIVKTVPLNVRDMNKQIQAYQSIALSAGRETPIGREALEKASQLRDKYVDIQNETKRLADDHRTLNGVMELASIGVAGYGAVQGAMALTGVESEALQKSMQKLMAAQTLLNSVNTIAKSLEKESASMLLLKDIRTKALIKTQALYSLVTGKSTKATKLFKVALASTGIGLLVVAIGALIANFDKLLGVFKPVIDGFKAIGDAIGLTDFAGEERFEAEQKRHDQTIANAKEEREAIDKLVDAEKKRQAQIQAVYDLQIKQARGNAKEIEKIENKKRKSAKESIDEEERLFLEGQKTRLKQLEAQQAKANNLKQKADDEGVAINQATLDKLAKADESISKLRQQIADNNFAALTDFNVRRANLDIDYAKGVEDREKARTDRYKQHLQDRLNAERKIEDLENALMEDGIEKELEINRDRFRRLLEDTKKNKKLNAKEREKLVELYTEQEEQAAQKIREKYDKIDIARERKRLENIEKQNNDFLDTIEAIAEQNYQNTLSDEERELRAVQDKYFALEEAAQGNANALIEIEIARLNEENDIKLRFQEQEYNNQKAIDDKKKADAKALADYRISVATQSLTAISDIAELFSKGSEKQAKRAFNVQKAVGIAQATINTAQAITKVFAETTDFTPTQSLRIANAVAIGVAGAAQIASIASQTFEGGGGGESPSVNASGGEAQAPSFNVVGDSSINQLAQLQQAPVQAFVVSGEVTTSQALDRNRVENATL
jgi:hypothetical protein|tara:strand:+ start:5799 stop:8135 length:2337 start_codon:yes stop_codon:yes gene_type:complete